MKHIKNRNHEILEKFYQDMQKILYCKASMSAKRKMLYSAHYWAKYFTDLNNQILKKQLKERD